MAMIQRKITLEITAPSPKSLVKTLTDRDAGAANPELARPRPVTGLQVSAQVCRGGGGVCAEAQAQGLPCARPLLYP